MARKNSRWNLSSLHFSGLNTEKAILRDGKILKIGNYRRKNEYHQQTYDKFLDARAKKKPS